MPNPHQLELTKAWLASTLQASADAGSRQIATEKSAVQLLFIKSVCDDKMLQKQIIGPFYEAADLAVFELYLCSLEHMEHEANVSTLQKVLDGWAAVFLPSRILLINVKKAAVGEIKEASVEASLQGPQNAFCESLETNLNLLRHRYPSPSLKLEFYAVGSRSRTKVALVYDRELADQSVVQKVQEQLTKVQVGVLQAAGQLHKLLTHKKWSLFPTMMITERPDRLIYNLDQGKVGLLIDGTPFTLIAPAVFYDFMSAMDDIYELSFVGAFLIFLRYSSLFVCLFLPSLYIALTSYNPEILRVQLMISIAGSRASVPYPSVIEVLFMLLMMELLLEASLRLPKSIGSTATTVGGLILGQAATQAGLVSNIMIIIVSTVAIANFVIPINAMSFSMRIIKYPLLLLSAFFGLIGLLLGFIGLIGFLTRLRSYGQPYLKLFLHKK